MHEYDNGLTPRAINGEDVIEYTPTAAGGLIFNSFESI